MFKYLKKYSMDDEELDKKSIIRRFVKEQNKENPSHYEKQMTFFEHIDYLKSRSLRTYERELIFYQMCGNLFIVCLILLFLYLIKFNLIVVVSSFLIGVLLLIGALIHSERARQWRDTLNEKKRGFSFNPICVKENSKKKDTT
jgi:Flp pilus assembly protein TadB